MILSKISMPKNGVAVITSRWITALSPQNYAGCRFAENALCGHVATGKVRTKLLRKDGAPKSTDAQLLS